MATTVNDNGLAGLAGEIRTIIGSAVPDDGIPRTLGDAYDMMALAVAERVGWQPIETAPDGCGPVLLYASCKGYEARVIVVGWQRNTAGDWIEACFYGNEPIGINPTHWMPLPDPPLTHS